MNFTDENVSEDLFNTLKQILDDKIIDGTVIEYSPILHNNLGILTLNETLLDLEQYFINEHDILHPYNFDLENPQHFLEFRDFISNRRIHKYKYNDNYYYSYSL